MKTEEEQTVRDQDNLMKILELEKIKEEEEVEEVEEIEVQIDQQVVDIITTMRLIKMDLTVLDLKLKMKEKHSKEEDSEAEGVEIEVAILEEEIHKNKNEKFEKNIQLLDYHLILVHSVFIYKF